MVTERMPEMPAATASAPAAGSAAADRALRAQLLATEHWSLLATRSLSWNESFARAGMFLTLLSGAIVALALVAQATSFGEGFVVFALLLLPVLLVVGLATYARLLEVNNEDLVWVAGMNRLRRAYLELAPDLERHFVTGVTEDRSGMLRTYGAVVETGGGLLHGLITTPGTIAFVNAMLAAVLAAVATIALQTAMAPAAGLGVVVFIASFLVLYWWGYRSQRMAGLVMGRLAEALPRQGESTAPDGPAS
ncbi:MAG TPA: hypothetical protein VHK63_04150 [Candidatus Limnocylindria bacterium]|nr:hypothetical protein [Candidatus Limnocylindria bacterium]